MIRLRVLSDGDDILGHFFYFHSDYQVSFSEVKEQNMNVFSWRVMLLTYLNRINSLIGTLYRAEQEVLRFYSPIYISLSI